MDSALQRRIQRYGWDKAAALYETFWHRQLKASQDRLLELAEIKKGEKILDIACGTGLISFRAAVLTGVDGHVTGTDISDNMISMASEVAKQKKMVQVDFERMDAETMSYPDNFFDAVLCSLGLMYFPEPLKALKEMFRVLKPGGHAIASVWGQRDRCGWADIFPIVDRRVTSEVCPMFFYLGSNQVLQTSFELAGFTDVGTESIQTLLSYRSDEEACGAAFAGGPVALAYFKFDENIKQQVHAEYLQSISGYKSKNGYEVPGEFVLTMGTKK